MSAAHDDWPSGFAAATCPRALGGAVSDFVKGSIGLSTFNFVPVLERPTTPDDMLAWSSERSLEPRLFADAIRVANDEFGAVDVLSRRFPRVLDTFVHLGGPAAVRRTRTFNEVWRPLRNERQLVLFLRSREVGPLGLVSVGRRERERPFSEEDRDRLEALREPIVRSLLAIRALEPSASGDVLALLASGLNVAAFVFDSRGRIIWLSDEALLRLEAEAVQWGATCCLTESSVLLAELRDLARRAIADPLGALREGHGVQGSTVRSSERLLLRTLVPQSSQGPLVLIALQAACGRCRGRDVAREATALGLAPREAEVAQLFAEGFSAVNIAGRLGKSPETVRKQIASTYRKLGVFNKAELALALYGRHGLSSTEKAR